MKQIFLAGFGGQGIQFSGKFLAYAGMLQGLHVSVFPSYGPESRGGTSSCGVVISEEPVASPVVLTPDIFICMNLPSLDKFENTLAKNGTLYIDSTLVTRKSTLTNANVHYIPATKLAYDNNLTGSANMIMVGKVIRESALCPHEFIPQAMKGVVSERRKDMFELNLKAIEIGLHFITEGE